MLRTRSMLTLVVVGALTACGGGEEAPEPGTGAEVAEAPAGGMEGMQGMGGMAGMQMGGGMMEQMQAHMKAMEGKSGDATVQMMPQHRQMVANMIAQMNREMQDMNMTADQEWDSTIAAVREDLVRLPEMSAQELESFMPDHRQRILSLMEMHRSMMGSMKM